MKLSKALVALAAVSTVTLAGVATAKPLVLKPRGTEGWNAPSLMPFASNAQYFGGPVISNVKVVSVMWGTDVNQEVQTGIGAFYQAAVDSNYLDWLNLYKTDINSTDGKPGSHQTIGRGTYGGQITITPQHTADDLDQAAIEAELDHQIGAGVLPKPDANTLYMIHFPSRVGINISWGKACETWAADHEGYKSPTNGYIYYAMMPECFNSSFEETTEAASHELVEAITDPACPIANVPVAFPAAWLTSDGQEIGDLCAWVGTKLTSAKGTYTVQAIWSNATSSCNNGPFSNP